MAIFRTARYEVQATALEAAQAVVARFVEAVNQNEQGVHMYRAFQDKDNRWRFVHLMEFDDEAAEAFHRDTPWVKEFTSGLYPLLYGGITFDELVPVAPPVAPPAASPDDGAVAGP